MIRQIHKYILLVAILSFTIMRMFAQDPIFSQFYSASLFLNPSMAADREGLSATFNNRTNTNKNISTYNLNQLSIIYPFKISNLLKRPTTGHTHQSGIGLSGYREGTGDEYTMNTMGGIFTIAHSVQITRSHHLALGLQGGYVNKKHSDNFHWGSQFTEGVGYDESKTSSVDDILSDKVSYPIFNAGIMWSFINSELKEHLKKLDFDAFLGFAIYNINKPKISFVNGGNTTLPMTTKLHGGISYGITKNLIIKPNFIWGQQNKDNQLNLGTYIYATTQNAVVEHKDIYGMLGVWYRCGDAFILSLGCKISTFVAAISYDFNTTNFEYKNRGKGAAEISVRYSLPPQKDHLHRGLMYPNYM